MKNENELEQACIKWFQDQGYGYISGGDLDGERESLADVVLRPRLEQAVQRLNPELPVDAVHQVIDTLLTAEPASLVQQNQRFHKMLLRGVPVVYSDGQESELEVHSHARFIDLNDVQSNEFLVVNQLKIQGKTQHRIPDLIVFINGLPLFVIELKSPTSESAHIWKAFNQLQTYKQDIPELFVFNEALVISDGVKARIGSLTAKAERFNPWRTNEHEADQPEFEYQLQTLVEGFFKRHLLLDYLSHFILFEPTQSCWVKKIAGYHQFHAVRAAFMSTLKAIRNENQPLAVAEPYAHYGNAPRLEKICHQSGKAGVVWHTQGSGKSISMICYASKLLKAQEMHNPTLVVVTDRNDLDGQLYDDFYAARALLNQTPQQVHSREGLRSVLETQKAGGIIFTTVQKFGLLEGETIHPVLSKRSNLVVISDEAHRSHYGHKAKFDQKTNTYRFGYAKHLKDAMPEACFIGFTGTPIAKTDKNTRDVFGEYISVYDIQKAVDDGATVPIYYESRRAKLDLNHAEIDQLNQEVEEELSEEEQEAREHIKSKWSSLQQLVGSRERIKQVAQDMVQHFEMRDQDFAGKAMVIGMSRKICVALYDAIIQLRPHWHSEDPKQGVIKVMMTGSAADSAELQPHLYSHQVKKDIEARFKNEIDPMKWVIVCDMWLTGFDVPCCHTMYIDKPMKDHNLMQAIARVNRVYHDKQGGLIVDYIGITHSLKEAYQTYRDSGGKDRNVIPAEQAFSVLKNKIDVIRTLFATPVQGKTVEYLDRFEQEPTDCITLMLNHLGGLVDTNELGNKVRNGKTRYLDSVTALRQAYSLCQTLDEVNSYKKEIAFYDRIKVILIKSTTVDTTRQQINRDSKMQDILNNAVVAEGVESLETLAGLTQSQVNLLSDEFLKDVPKIEHQDLAVDLLHKLLNDEIKARSKSNIVQSKTYSSRLEATLLRYQNNNIETAEVLKELIKFAQDIKKDDEHSKKLNLKPEELAFYHALADNESAARDMEHEALRSLAIELTEKLRKSVTVDWQKRESVRARMRTLIRRLLKRYKYPPDKADSAIKQVIEQAEVMAENMTL